MSDQPGAHARLLSPAQVGEVLSVGVDEVMTLVGERRLRGVRVGSPAQWRIEAASLEDYLDDQAEEARRMALWRQSNAASFSELWGTGRIRHPD